MQAPFSMLLLVPRRPQRLVDVVRDIAAWGSLRHEYDLLLLLKINIVIKQTPKY